MAKKFTSKADSANQIKSKVSAEAVESVESELFKNVRAILAKARATVYTAANTAMVEAKWSTRILQRQIDTQFYMELGRGFCLEAEQKTLRIGDETYSCDLVFYNYIARCFFLVDLKVGKVTPQGIGQMQLYKHYYEREMMHPGDNPPVGIVLGSSADSAVVKYTLNEHERNLFAVNYHLSLPTVEELQRELKRERAAIAEALLLQELNEK